MPKKVFLVHRWEGSPEKDWMPWLKRELEKKGFRVFAPLMPDAANPEMDSWLNHLLHITKIAGDPNKDWFFVGHSLGCITILRYIETLKENQKIGGAVLVAGFADDLEIPELSDFYKEPVDWQKIKSHCRNFIAVNSDNDPYVPLKHGYAFKEKLGAELVVMHKHGHFSGSEGFVELPVALEAVLKMAEE
ncbi:MAG: serine hydrolase family protein [Candidatus Aenigmarchaeota archaeon]|nr:serine hydrolase family protein [Candidatus Aenigmarchaeota archaeon]